MRLTRRPFGTLPDGTPIDEFVLADGTAIELRAIPYGGIITAIMVPDRGGRAGNVVLGHDGLDAYLDNAPYFGALVGRYANRIALGRFTLDGRTYQLATNNGRHHLHGGERGFDRQLWDVVPVTAADAVGVAFSRTSAAGEEQYPGTLQATVSYRLTGRGEILIDYDAIADAPTVVNLTQHTYFNLTADASRTVLGHELMLQAEHYTPVDDELIPTGHIAPVAGTRFDFRTARPIGEGNYDHNWAIARRGDGLAHAARAVDPDSGRTLDVWTTEPGVQFYDGNLLGGAPPPSWKGRAFPRHAGFCLETQHYPDSPNNPQFPSTVLRPGQRYRSSTVWRFGIG